MKHTIAFLWLASLILSACAPAAAPTVAPATGAALLPTATPAPGATPTAAPTATPTPIPTIQVGELSVPDPAATNPELFDLTNPNAPIPQFVNAMRMAGIEVTGEQVAQGITYQQLQDKDGNPFVVAVYNLDPNPSQTGETLEGPIPLMIWDREGGWREMTLKFGNNIGGALWPQEIGTKAENIARESYSLISITDSFFWQWLLADSGNLDIVRRTSDIHTLSYRLRLDFGGVDQIVSSTPNQTYMAQILTGEFNPSWINELTDDEFGRLAQAVTLRILKRYPNAAIINIANEYGYHSNDDLLRRANFLEVARSVAHLVKNENRKVLINVDGVIPGLTTYFWDGRGDTRRHYFEVLRNTLLEEGLLDIVGLGGHFYVSDFINPDGSINEERIQLVSDFVHEQNQLGLLVIWTEADLRVGDLPPGPNRDLIQAEVGSRLAQIFISQTENIPRIIFYGSTSNWLGEDEDATPWTQPDGERKAFYYGIIRELISP